VAVLPGYYFPSAFYGSANKILVLVIKGVEVKEKTNAQDKNDIFYLSRILLSNLGKLQELLASFPDGQQSPNQWQHHLGVNAGQMLWPHPNAPPSRDSGSKVRRLAAKLANQGAACLSFIAAFDISPSHQSGSKAG